VIELIVLAALVQPVWIGQFSGSGAVPPPWRVVQVGRKVPPTQYRRAIVAGVPAIEARAERSMALLARPIAARSRAATCSAVTGAPLLHFVRAMRKV